MFQYRLKRRLWATLWQVWAVGSIVAVIALRQAPAEELGSFYMTDYVSEGVALSLAVLLVLQAVAILRSLWWFDAPRAAVSAAAFILLVLMAASGDPALKTTALFGLPWLGIVLMALIHSQYHNATASKTIPRLGEEVGVVKYLI